jgi:membrane protein implicated in regulation of membrane protease activity
MMWTVWWVWMVAGLIIGACELLLPGFIFLGFAIGALLTGLLLLVGVLGGSVPALLSVFAVLSLLAWLVLRRTVGVRQHQVKIWKHDINDN